MTDATATPASEDTATSNADQAGFTATVTVPATPEAVFAYFTEPELFAHWFVVDGYTTPAEEIRLDPRPGGAVTGVMVSDNGTTRIPFHIRYGRVDPPRLVQFTFTEPEETVTLDVQPMTRRLTRVNYRKPYGNGDDVHGAQSMLDALASSIASAAPMRSSHEAPPADAAAPVDLARLAKHIELPPDFEAPTDLRYAGLQARPISRVDLEADVAGINASVELIRRTRGGHWPTGPVTADDNYIDLVWHEREFRDRTSFTYAVYDDAGQYLGCCYLYPVGLRSPLTQALLRHDVDVSWWVTPDAYRAGHYRTLYHALRRWTTTAFPFANPHYSNLEVPTPQGTYTVMNR